MIALIMAGGTGTRFWPVSRQNFPKQFINVQGSTSMLQKTVERLLPKVCMHDIYVVTAADQVHLVKRQLPRLPEDNIIAEPFGMNTAPCIALSVEYLKARYADGEVMLVVPADHVIRDVPAFLNSLIPAEKEARNGRLITFGIVPEYAATGYGYIEAGEEIAPKVLSVLRFKEKPDKDTAEQFLKSGSFYWNSGMFCWSIGAIYDAFCKLLPEIPKLTATIADIWESKGLNADISDIYAKMPRLPIDVGIMEKAEQRGVIPVAYGWSDVGSWKALADITITDREGNHFSSYGTALEAKGNYVQSSKFTAIIGLDNVCVIETPDAILVCTKDKSEEVKKVVDMLKTKEDSNLI
ncbi:MAG: sugar phosphate nucleotidyltransferase [Candidatus Cloacimonetes bacterium]|nr:sugar phosphate nucleotidyltransferase [Candidatus Cloacimonadota bacterium]